MNSKLLIATFPISVLSFFALLLLSTTLKIPTFVSILIFSTFYLYIVVFLLRRIFFGRFKGYSLDLGNNEKEIIRSTIGLLLLSILFGYAFSDMVFKVVINAKTNVWLLLLISTFLSILINYFEYKTLKFFKAEKISNGIKMSELKNFICWYHYIAVLLIILVILPDLVN